MCVRAHITCRDYRSYSFHFDSINDFKSCMQKIPEIEVTIKSIIYVACL